MKIYSIVVNKWSEGVLIEIINIEAFDSRSILAAPRACKGRSANFLKIMLF